MNNYDELINRLRDTTHIPYHIHTMEAADTIESLQARVEELEEWAILRDNEQGRKIKKIVDENGSLQARVEELEEKAEFNERWISQTCETGQIRAERNQNIATDAAWILTVSPLPEPPE